MEDFMLELGDENPTAKKIRDMLGAGNYEQVRCILPQFEREDGKVITYIPTTIAEYDALKNAPDDILKGIGLQRWGKYDLWLFPAEWYDHIPEGYEIMDIFGKTEEFEKGVTDDDRRFGCLSFGLAKLSRVRAS